MPIKYKVIDSGEKLYFSEGVKKLRKERGITQETMADKLSVSLKTFQNWENKKACPDTIEALFLICDILDCDIEFIFGLQSLPRRIDANIHDETGLPPAAINRLRAMSRDKSGPGYDGLMGLLTALIIHGEYAGVIYCEYQKAKAEYTNKKEYYQQMKQRCDAVEMSETEFFDMLQSTLKEAEFKVLLAIAEAIQQER